jgi:hypothetical protein
MSRLTVYAGRACTQSTRDLFSARPALFFDEAARRAVLKSEFSPARSKKGGLVPCTMGVMMRYVMPITGPGTIRSSMSS